MARELRDICNIRFPMHSTRKNLCSQGTSSSLNNIIAKLNKVFHSDWIVVMTGKRMVDKMGTTNYRKFDSDLLMPRLQYKYIYYTKVFRWNSVLSFLVSEIFYAVIINLKLQKNIKIYFNSVRQEFNIFTRPHKLWTLNHIVFK